MKNLFKSNYKILLTDIIEKESIDGVNKYYIVKLYLEFCESIITCFVDKPIYDQIKENKINDTNIIEHLYFKIDKDMKIHIFIK